ncbi:MAG: glycosyltransferase family 4 protein [Candidatus Omnitrophota bacterium]
MKILLFAASFPPPRGAGSVEYLYHIFGNLPKNSVVVHTANADPVEARAFDLSFSQRIIRDNFILHVLSGYYTGPDLWLILKRKLPRLREFLFWPIKALFLILREHPDIVCIGEQNFVAIAAWIAWRIWRVPYIYFTYAEELTIVNNYPVRKHIHFKILQNAATVITVSEYTRSLLVEGGVSSDKIIKIIPAVGAEKKKTVSAEQIAEVRRKYHLDGHRILLTVGALITRKGHATVLEALPLIKSGHPKVKYVIAGGGPCEHELRQQAVNLGLNDDVIFAGRVNEEELTCLYEICEVFVMPHRQVPGTLDTEGCPTVFLEAGAHGKPVVGGNAGGVADAIKDGVTGFIINGTDHEIVAETVSSLLTNHEMASEMGKAGREYALNLTPSRNAHVFWKICQSIEKKENPGSVENYCKAIETNF